MLGPYPEQLSDPSVSHTSLSVVQPEIYQQLTSLPFNNELDLHIPQTSGYQGWQEPMQNWNCLLDYCPADLGWFDQHAALTYPPAILEDWLAQLPLQSQADEQPEAVTTVCELQELKKTLLVLEVKIEMLEQRLQNLQNGVKENLKRYCMQIDDYVKRLEDWSVDFKEAVEGLAVEVNDKVRTLECEKQGSRTACMSNCCQSKTGH